MRRNIGLMIRRGIMPQGYELHTSDVGDMLEHGFGNVLKSDVGRKVWVKPYGLVMENNEQMRKRKSRKNPRVSAVQYEVAGTRAGDLYKWARQIGRDRRKSGNSMGSISRFPWMNDKDAKAAREGLMEGFNEMSNPRHKRRKRRNCGCKYRSNGKKRRTSKRHRRVK